MQTAAEHEQYERDHPREAFARSHITLGAAGHWIKTAGILAPLVIGEFVKDADKRWRYIRLASVATALISEGLYTNRIRQQREECRERKYEGRG
jgi:hypothetical protein